MASSKKGIAKRTIECHRSVCWPRDWPRSPLYRETNDWQSHAVLETLRNPSVALDRNTRGARVNNTPRAPSRVEATLFLNRAYFSRHALLHTVQRGFSFTRPVPVFSWRTFRDFSTAKNTTLSRRRLTNRSVFALTPGFDGFLGQRGLRNIGDSVRHLLPRYHS